MMCAKPIIAAHTGGQKRQVVDHRDGSENGFSLPIEFQTMVGSQNVPYIYEDYCHVETIVDRLMKMYELGPEGRKKLGKKAQDYAFSEFALENTVAKWDQSLTELIDNWREKYNRWDIKEI